MRAFPELKAVTPRQISQIIHKVLGDEQFQMRLSERAIEQAWISYDQNPETKEMWVALVTSLLGNSSIEMNRFRPRFAIDLLPVLFLGIAAEVCWTPLKFAINKLREFRQFFEA